jgi:hypothetical protein
LLWRHIARQVQQDQGIQHRTPPTLPNATACPGVVVGMGGIGQLPIADPEVVSGARSPNTGLRRHSSYAIAIASVREDSCAQRNC